MWCIYIHSIHRQNDHIHKHKIHVCVHTHTQRGRRRKGRREEERGEGEQFQRSLSELHWPLYFLACSKGSGPYDEEQMESKLLIWGSLELKETKKKKTDVSYLLHGAMPKGWRIPD